MSKQGSHQGTFVPIPLNLPAVIDIPTNMPLLTDSEKKHSSGVKDHPKLPLYGPLNIGNYEEFMKEQKLLFHERYKHSCDRLDSIDAYKYLYILGRGDFSRFVVARKGSENFALKIFPKHILVEKNMVEKVLEEKRILQSLDCPFCIRLEHIFQNTFELIFILPFISGGELFTHIQRNRRFDEHMSRFYAAQVVLALEYLHHCDVVYRELKPESILLDHLGYLKISKFSSAKVVATRTYTLCSTPEYVAPEMIVGKGYGKSVDWWAVGIFLFEMSAGHPPFISHNVATTYKNIKAAKYSMPVHGSKELHDLIHKLLQPDVSKRLGGTKKGTGEIKSHKWFKGFNWVKLANRQLDPPFVPGKSLCNINYPTLASSSAYNLKSNSSNVEQYFKDF